MTARDLIPGEGQHAMVRLVAFVALPVLAWLTGGLRGSDQGKFVPWKYFYAVLVYLGCGPGMLAGLITACALLWIGEHVLDANLLVYFLPIGSMVATLVLIRRNVSFDDVPGFDCLSSLMVMVGCSFAIALAVQKTRKLIFFGGSIEKLFLLAAAVFALLKWGTYMVFGRRDEPKQERPNFPDASAKFCMSSQMAVY